MLILKTVFCLCYDLSVKWAKINHDIQYAYVVMWDENVFMHLKSHKWYTQ